MPKFDRFSLVGLTEEDVNIRNLPLLYTYIGEKGNKEILNRLDETQLYRHFDGQGNLLYVGISKSAFTRLSGHQLCAHWYRSVRRIDIEVFPNRKAALEAEEKAIKEECPRYNTIFNDEKWGKPKEDIWPVYLVKVESVNSRNEKIELEMVEVDMRKVKNPTEERIIEAAKTTLQEQVEAALNNIEVSV